ncbi:MAG: nucleotidyltransferase family protein [Anaerolineae bacterium]|nr:nucleotidyltransferase family protein [Gloeobacterales cyanobacterium ES-bin-313]
MNKLQVAVARFLSCPPALRQAPPDLSTLDPQGWLALNAYLTERNLALAAYEHWIMDKAADPAPAVRTDLRKSYIAASACVQWMQKELIRLLKAFATAHIEVVVLKGLHLGTLLWSDPALRPFGDIDLWVQPEAIPSADALLRQMGYQGGPENLAAPLDWRYHELPNYNLANHQLPFGAVDLHYRLAPQYLAAVNEKEIFARAIPWWAGSHVLAPEDLIVYITGHVARHLFVETRPALLYHVGYRYLGELARLICASQVDWSRVAQQFAESEHRRALILPLRMIRSLWGIAFPQAITQLWQTDLLGEAILKIMLTRFDHPWQARENQAFSFWNYALPDHIHRFGRKL